MEIDFRARVWGGQRLKAGPDNIGEAWIAYEHNRVKGGPHAGQTLAEVAAQLGPALLGSVPWSRTGARFPLLIKVLDCEDWLSVQVHPNDIQAARLEGHGAFGKTEAWHILEAASGARLIAGTRPGVDRDALAAAIAAGSVLDVVAFRDARAGDTVLMPAGTMHALGPGLLIYEVQQTSDLTYRVWDWDRPASAGRSLHIAQSLEVVDPESHPRIRSQREEVAIERLTSCDYFTLDKHTLGGAARHLDTRGRSFHVVTAVAGDVLVSGRAGAHRLEPYETVIVPADEGDYTLRGVPTGTALVAAAGDE